MFKNCLRNATLRSLGQRMLNGRFAQNYKKIFLSFMVQVKNVKKSRPTMAASGLYGEIWCIQNNNRHYYNGHYHFRVTSNSKYLLFANRVSLEIRHIPTAKASVLSIVPSGFSSYLCSVILITLRSQAAPRHRASSLHSVCTDFGTQNF